MSKLKELKRRSTIAWSVSNVRPDLIAAGTMAGTVGLDFDTSAQLEIFSLDVESNDQNLTLVGKTVSPFMFHKIVWGQSANGKYGILAGGMDNGSITIWDPSKISSSEGGLTQAGSLGNAQKHKGPVQALDFNPFQQNLLASGATDSEIFIWDLGKPAEPTVYTPGAKPQQASDIANVAWNKKVQHILASTQYSGMTVIWDLKAKKPVISFADRNSKARSKSIAWHPAEATQILTASEEDDAPVLQMWDLRNVFTPVRTFNGHTRGVWGVSWSPFDHSLVLSCGKDNRTLCWHAETAEVLCEVEGGGDSSVWNFDVQWSPRIPAILSTSSLEGKVNIYALQDVCERTVIASESFGGAQMQQPSSRTTIKHTPGWFQRPCGVAFGFGGKLVSFERSKDSARKVSINNVVTERDILDRSEKLEEAISSGKFTDFCDEKISEAKDDEKSTWSFLRVLFDSDARHKILNYLGFDEAMTQQEIKDFIASLPAEKSTQSEATAEKEEKEPSPPPSRRSPTPPPASTETEDVEAESTEDKPAEHEEGGDKESKDVSGLFSGGDEFTLEHQQTHTPRSLPPPRSLAAYPLPAQAHPVPSAHPEGHTHDHSHDHDHDDLQQRHDHDEVPSHHPTQPQKPAYAGPPIEIPTSEPGAESIITKALLIGNFEAAVQCCLQLDRIADALILAASGGPELWARTQEAYFARQTHPYARVMSAVVRNDLGEIVEHSVLRDWKATLATLCTYTKSSDFPKLCSALGDRLDKENDLKAAILCYICAGSIDKAVSIWVRSSSAQKNPHLVLQDLVEKISIFRQAVGDNNDLNDILASKYSEYAGILAAQGRAQASLRYLSFLNDPKYSNTSGAILLDRVYHHTSEQKAINEPIFPFSRVEIYSQAQQQAAQYQQAQQQQYQQQTQAQAQYQQPTQSQYQQPTQGQYQQSTQGQYQQPTQTQTQPQAQRPTYSPNPTQRPTYSPNPTQPAAHGSHATHGAHAYSTPSVYGAQPTQPSVYTPQSTSTYTPPPMSTFTPPVSTFTPQATSTYNPPPPSTFMPTPPPTSYATPSAYQQGTLPPPTHGTTHFSPSTNPAMTSAAVPPPPTVYQPSFVPSQPAMTPATPPTKPTIFTPQAQPTSHRNSLPPSSRPASPPRETAPPPPSATTPATPAQPVQPAQPAPDTSFLINSLQTHISAAQANAARQPQFKAKGDDMMKRLGALTERLAKPGAVTPQSIDALTRLVSALNAQDMNGASGVLVQLSTGTNDVGASAVIGLKHLITLSKSF